MQLFVLRHGHAEADAPTDKQRPLSLAGVHEVKTIIARCADELEKVERVFVSPYLRAQQTFQVASEVLPTLRKNVHKEDLDLIVPGGNPQAVIDFLVERRINDGLQSVLLITHQPFAGTFVDKLCDLETGAYRIGTAGLAAIDVDPVAAGLGVLRWLKHP